MGPFSACNANWNSITTAYWKLWQQEKLQLQQTVPEMPPAFAAMLIYQPKSMQQGKKRGDRVCACKTNNKEMKNELNWKIACPNEKRIYMYICIYNWAHTRMQTPTGCRLANDVISGTVMLQLHTSAAIVLHLVVIVKMPI